jgi:anti-anti-sigma factor
MLGHIDPTFTVRAIKPPDGRPSLCLKVSGHLAGENAHTLRRAVEPVFASPNPPLVYLIMDDVRYMDSTGVGVIVAIIQQMRRRGGKLEIRGLSDVGRQLLHILSITSLSQYVTVSGRNDIPHPGGVIR